MNLHSPAFSPLTPGSVLKKDAARVVAGFTEAGSSGHAGVADPGYNVAGIFQQAASRGFTLVELLVAITVLVLLLLMVTQLTNSAGLTVANSGKHMDADTEARLVLGRIGLELAKMVKRPDVDYSTFKQPESTLPARYGSASQPDNPQPGNDRLAFYSETTGYFTSQSVNGTDKAPVSLVAYTIGTDPYANSPAPVLRRMGKGLGWDPDPSGPWQSMAYLPITLTTKWPALFTTDADFNTVGYQIFRFEYAYLLKPNNTDPANPNPARLSITPWDTTTANTSINGFKDVAAIVVAIAVLDSRSRVIVSDYSQLTSRTLFPDADANGTDIASSWQAVVNRPDFASLAKIPKLAASGVRIYQRYFYLDTP